eukprot:COSAG05_NODE_276_length_12393_cov_1737.505694_23_plen_440_part_01
MSDADEAEDERIAALQAAAAQRQLAMAGAAPGLPGMSDPGVPGHGTGSEGGRGSPGRHQATTPPPASGTARAGAEQGKEPVHATPPRSALGERAAGRAPVPSAGTPALDGPEEAEPPLRSQRHSAAQSGAATDTPPRAERLPHTRHAADSGNIGGKASRESTLEWATRLDFRRNPARAGGDGSAGETPPKPVRSSMAGLYKQIARDTGAAASSPPLQHPRAQGGEQRDVKNAEASSTASTGPENPKQKEEGIGQMEAQLLAAAATRDGGRPRDLSALERLLTAEPLPSHAPATAAESTASEPPATATPPRPDKASISSSLATAGAPHEHTPRSSAGRKNTEKARRASKARSRGKGEKAGAALRPQQLADGRALTSPTRVVTRQQRDIRCSHCLYSAHFQQMVILWGERKLFGMGAASEDWGHTEAGVQCQVWARTSRINA